MLLARGTYTAVLWYQAKVVYMVPCIQGEAKTIAERLTPINKR
jgi:hypothetical protein